MMGRRKEGRQPADPAFKMADEIMVFLPSFVSFPSPLEIPSVDLRSFRVNLRASRSRVLLIKTTGDESIIKVKLFL